MLLYIHIPFCDSKCHYCAFNSYTSLHSLRDDYMKALYIQLKTELEIQNKLIETIFIGGGTPSTIEASYYKTILNIVNPYLENSCEITIEANPNSATSKWLKDIYSIGINRVSFGVQSFNNEKLDFLGRNHNKEQAFNAIKNAYNIGFKDINLDIIYDTRLDTKELLDNDLEIIKILPINHISTYSLTIEEGTKFFSKSNVRLEDENLARYFFAQLESLGFKQYEISNFSKSDASRSKHNLGYWQYKEYLGIGSGAVACYANKRFYGQNDVLEYIKDPLNYENIEHLSDDDIIIEKLLLGFRSVVGVSCEILDKKQMIKIKELESIKKIDIKDNYIYAKDFMLADELVLYLQ
ncbi:MAG: radical SAM family heme chaperone HemW [Campylobacterota bacterium]|nr:radical SAM family heme chaperone HemW [Campylobacterota bacterium]